MLECLTLFLAILALGLELGERDARESAEPPKPDPFRLDRWKAGQSAELKDD
jgi:hypothetical protein